MRENTLKHFLFCTVRDSPDVSPEEAFELAVSAGYESATFKTVRGTLWTLSNEGQIASNSAAAPRKRGAVNGYSHPATAPRRRFPTGGTAPEPEPSPIIPPETPEERSARISKRFDTLDRLAQRLVENKIPAMIVSGPPGLGKSYTLEQKVREMAEAKKFPGEIISGTISAPGLIMTLHEYREGGTIVADDCDDIFRDETCLNILKAVLDSSEKRIVTYKKLAKWMEENDIPTSFEFKGSIAFCTNLDFEREIGRGSRMAPHFMALMDRSLYLTLTLRDQDDYLCRIRQVAIGEGLLKQLGLNDEQSAEVMAYIEQHAGHFYSLSIRLAIQIAGCVLATPETWREDVAATQLRTIRV